MPSTTWPPTPTSAAASPRRAPTSNRTPSRRSRCSKRCAPPAVNAHHLCLLCGGARRTELPTPETLPDPGADVALRRSKMAVRRAGLRVLRRLRLRGLRLPLRVAARPALSARPRLRLREAAARRSDDAADPGRRLAAQELSARRGLRPGPDAHLRGRAAGDRGPRKFEVYHLGVPAFCLVRDSARWICDELGVSPQLEFGTGNRGWIGDSPFVFLDVQKAMNAGWSPATRSNPRCVRRPAGSSTIAGSSTGGDDAPFDVAILAGGQGTRLRERAGSLPKPMVPLLGTPLLDHQLALCRAHGFSRVLLLVHHAHEVIRAHFGDGSRYGVSVEYAVEATPRGTAGALHDALPQLADTFLVLYGDTYLDVDLRRMRDAHAQRRADATLFVHPNDHPQDSDLVELDDDRFRHRAAPVSARRRSGLRQPGECRAVRDAARGARAADPARRQGRPREGPLSADAARRPAPVRLCVAGIHQGRRHARTARSRGGRHRGRHARTAVGARAAFGGLSRSRRHAERGRPLPQHARAAGAAPGVPEALRRLNRAGRLAVVVTNQAAVARGDVTPQGSKRIHARLTHLLGARHAYLDAIYVCPHHPDRGFPGEVAELKMRVQLPQARDGHDRRGLPRPADRPARRRGWWATRRPTWKRAGARGSGPSWSAPATPGRTGNFRFGPTTWSPTCRRPCRGFWTDTRRCPPDGADRRRGARGATRADWRARAVRQELRGAGAAGNSGRSAAPRMSSRSTHG